MLRTFLELTKFRIAAFSTLSAATGYLAFTSVLRPGVLTSSAGLLLLALGASALNEWQDRELDARMERTRRRPLPAGAISGGSALAVAAVLIALGAIVLGALHGAVPAILGLAAVAWYNGFYTYLKRVWEFAAVPGAVIGAIPPAVGWTAAGGRATDPHILGLCFFFFLWQVPHFWLLLSAHGREYEAAGLPSLTRVFRPVEFARLIFVWTLATVGSSLLLRVFGLVTSPSAVIGLVAAGAAMGTASLLLLWGRGGRASFRRAFAGINAYALAVMGIVVLDAVVLY